MFDKLAPIPATPAFKTMQERINEQMQQVARTEPGQPEHRLAMNTLLLLRDSMALLAATHDLLDRLKKVEELKRMPAAAPPCR